MNITCGGPGPHTPADGILGTTDRPTSGMLCPPCADLDKAKPQPVDVANRAALTTKAGNALTANATFLAKASPLILSDLEAQVRLLTRENNAVIRLLIGQLDTTTGT